jgi:hypothetical protein
MHYLHRKAAVDAIKFTADVDKVRSSDAAIAQASDADVMMSADDNVERLASKRIFTTEAEWRPTMKREEEAGTKGREDWGPIWVTSPAARLEQ